MKVKLTGHWGAKGPGDVVTVDEGTGADLMSAGVGKAVRESTSRSRPRATPKAATPKAPASTGEPKTS